MLLLLSARRTDRLALWSFTPAVGIVADILTLVGLVVALWARMTLGALWSSRVVLKEEHTIIETGPYAYVRHPIYTGVLLMTLGTVVLTGTLIGALLFAVAFCWLSFRARREERLLSEHLPEAYRRYRARVRWALVPFLL